MKYYFEPNQIYLILLNEILHNTIFVSRETLKYGNFTVFICLYIKKMLVKIFDKTRRICKYRLLFNWFKNNSKYM